MTTAAASSRTGRGFTLIEALGVIAIIALLAALLFPAVRLVHESARRRLAMQRARGIVQTFKQYRAAYGQWPGQTAGDADITFTNAPAILAALTNNPRRMVLFQDNELPVVNDAFQDPWNHPFVVAVDWNGDGRTDMTNDMGWLIVTNVNDTVAVASGGPDPANPAKRVYSWVPR